MPECSKIAELLGGYVYGDLSAEEMHRVRTHVSECAACASDIETRMQTISLIPNVVPKLSDLEKQRIIWSVKGAIKARENVERPSLFPRLVFQGAVLAVVAITAFLAGGAFQHKQAPAKVIVREVPVSPRPKPKAEPPMARGDEPSINQPTVGSREFVAREPVRRDRIPETYRRRSVRDGRDAYSAPVEQEQFEAATPPDAAMPEDESVVKPVLAPEGAPDVSLEEPRVPPAALDQPVLTPPAPQPVDETGSRNF